MKREECLAYKQIAFHEKMSVKVKAIPKRFKRHYNSHNFSLQSFYICPWTQSKLTKPCKSCVPYFLFFPVLPIINVLFSINVRIVILHAVIQKNPSSLENDPKMWQQHIHSIQYGIAAIRRGPLILRGGLFFIIYLYINLI